jgi:plastocyanin
MKRAQLLALVSVPVLAAAAVPIAAHATRSPAKAPTANVAVAASEFKFNVRPTSAKPGTVTFRVVNAGKIGHDFKIANKATPILQPRKTASLSVNLKPGTYPYLCTVPGHAASGMKGTFRVG